MPSFFHYILNKRNHRFNGRFKGFTLIELLVSLTVLELISALTLPTLFSNIHASQERVVFKETIQVMQSILLDAAQTEVLAGGYSAGGGGVIKLSFYKVEPCCGVSYYSSTVGVLYFWRSLCLIFGRHRFCFAEWCRGNI